jgi:hypothetical protein
MIHSRPGFAPRKSDAAPAKLNDDMIPALHRTAKESSSPLKFDAAAFEAQLEAHKRAHPAIPIEPAPHVLVNPTPSATPLVNEPGK